MCNSTRDIRSSREIFIWKIFIFKKSISLNLEKEKRQNGGNKYLAGQGNRNLLSLATPCISKGSPNYQLQGRRKTSSCFMTPEILQSVSRVENVCPALSPCSPPSVVSSQCPSMQILAIKQSLSPPLPIFFCCYNLFNLILIYIKHLFLLDIEMLFVKVISLICLLSDLLYARLALVRQPSW